MPPRHFRRLPVFFLLAAVPAAWAAAAEAPASSAPSTSLPPSSYTDEGTTTTRVDTTNSFTRDNNYYSSPFRDAGWPGNTTSTIVTHYRVLLAPPIPPALGEPIPARTAPAVARFSPTATLAGFVYEPFFTPLSPLLFSEDLSRARREKLNAFRTARSAALAALRARLDSLQSLPAERRADGLAAFAREQAPALADLERTAEEMRANYVAGGFFESGIDWNDNRSWRLGDNTRWESNLDEIKVMLGAAYFQDGLSPAQRRLLRELALELDDSVRAPLAEISLGTPGPFFYFSPETSRIRLPAELPPELAQTIQAYQNEKADLKQELRNVLYKQDRTFFGYRRTNAIRALAEQQAARFADLDRLAEQIRTGLLPLPNPAKPTTVPLPRDLLVRVGKYRDTKDEWQRAMLAKIETLRNALPEDRVEFVRQKDSLVIQIVGNRRSSAENSARRDTLSAELAAFNTAHAASYAALAREKEALHAEVLQAASSIAGHNSSKSIEMLLAEFSYSFTLQERWERYADYETAVLQPGLSPEQRRLLFGAAIESFDLSPGGSF